MQDVLILEDHEKLKDKLKNILVKSLFNWTGAFNISSSSHFSFYGVLSFFSSLVRPYLCIHNVY
jgi:hypothetical protein